MEPLQHFHSPPLRQDPDALAALADPRQRRLARAFIADVEAEKKMEVYKVRNLCSGEGRERMKSARLHAFKAVRQCSAEGGIGAQSCCGQSAGN